MTKDFDQWVSLWNSKPKRFSKSKENYLFVVVYPNNLEWDFGVEKQTQITTMHVSGGRTGAGTGHHIEFVHQKELYEFLKTQTVYDDGLQSYYTHAMIVSVGMVFDMTPSMTPIDEFYHWAESNMLFCKAHIIAKPNESAYLHHQHIELNLTQWREIGCPDIFGKRIWRNYDRSHINFHDDYTPLHLTPLGLPRIDNFSNTERSKKSFAYGHMEDRKKLQNDTWNKISVGNFDDVDREDYYFSRFMTRMRETFYITNNETNQTDFPSHEFDLIITPTAGYIGEVYTQKLNFNGDIIFYDYRQENLDLKRKIVEMNMSYDELKVYRAVKSYDWQIDMGTHQHLIEEGIECQSKMLEECNIDYVLMDLIIPDYEWLKDTVRDRKVFFNASNIYGYHMTHAVYTLDELMESWKRLQYELLYSKNFYLRGAGPTKKWEYIYV